MSTPEQLSILLKIGLWGGKAEPSAFSAYTDWKAIYRLAQQQTVVGLVYDGLSTLPAELQPESALLHQWYAYVVKIEQSHKLLNQRLAEVTNLLKLDDIRSVLLKGQGVAQNYPNPVRRHCGDIDLYIGKREYQRACVSTRIWNLDPGHQRDDMKHYHFQWRGVTIELHRVTMDSRKFQRWTESLLNSEKVRRWRIEGVDILLPPTNFDAIYIFNHAYRHFILEGVGFRQLCDWALYLHKFNDEIDRQALERDLKAFGLMRAWQTFGYIAVDQLGLAKANMPFYTERYNKKARRVSEYILRDGNFGHYSRTSVQPKSYLRGKLHSMMRYHRRALKLFHLFPKDTGIQYIHATINGIMLIVKDKTSSNRNKKR